MSAGGLIYKLLIFPVFFLGLGFSVDWAGEVYEYLDKHQIEYQIVERFLREGPF